MSNRRQYRTVITKGEPHYYVRWDTRSPTAFNDGWVEVKCPQAHWEPGFGPCVCMGRIHLPLIDRQ
jgi:hypothetical protein